MSLDWLLDFQDKYDYFADPASKGFNCFSLTPVDLTKVFATFDEALLSTKMVLTL